MKRQGSYAAHRPGFRRYPRIQWILPHHGWRFTTPGWCLKSGGLSRRDLVISYGPALGLLSELGNQREVVVMKQFYEALGNVAAITGIILCAIAGGARLLGSYYVLGFAAATFFLGGTALMVFACLTKLQLLLMKEGGVS